MTRFSPNSARKECRICQSPLPIRHLAVSNLQPPRLASGPIRSAEQNGGGGRNARATSRARARSLGAPPVIHPRESPAAAGSAAIIRQAQELSRFALHTLRQIVAPRKTKTLRPCAETVEDDISLWKMEENKELLVDAHFVSQRQKRKAPSITRGLQILDDVCQTLTIIERSRVSSRELWSRVTRGEKKRHGRSRAHSAF
jgi:hypothetical protein